MELENTIHTENNKRSSIAIWVFVGVVLGLPILYWIAFNVAAAVNIELSKDILGTLRGFGPTIAAMVALAYLSGTDSIRKLWARVFQWRISGRLYAVALLAPFGAMIAALGITYFLYPDVLAFGEINAIKLIAIFFILPLVDGPLGEEIGWRGFFLPLLMQRHNALRASLIVGLIWFLWHLPHYHVDGRDMGGLFLPKYLIYSIALSLIHTWLFQRAQSSILIHIVFHNAVNYMVLLGVMLFPAIETVAVTEMSYLVAMVTLGLFAGLSIWRQHHSDGF